MSDKYDEAITYLTKYPGELYAAWNNAHNHPAGCLFSHVSPTGHRDNPSKICGCLTQIRGGYYDAYTSELTVAIRNDKRIPFEGEQITAAQLPIFAEWQRRIDKELSRTP